MGHTTYAGDPRWITARYNGFCLKCGGAIKRDDPVWFYPRRRYDRTSKTFCEKCGSPMARQFHAEAEDEDFLNRTSGGYIGDGCYR